MTGPLITPVILSGGEGARLWPLSRQLRPKQFLPLSSDRSLFADTLGRIKRRAFAEPVVVCNENHRFIVAEELRVDGMSCRSIISEPVARNTAAAIAAAAVLLSKPKPHELMLVLPADHIIDDLAVFHSAVEKAAEAARKGFLVTFGVKPTHPETGYGYIDVGEEIDGVEECNVVRKFTEKPNLELATEYLKSECHVWNSGIFLFSPEVYLEELARFQPEIAFASKAAVNAAQSDSMFLRLEEREFSRSPALSIDLAVMEKTDRAAVVRVDMGWSDVGAWPTLSKLGDEDEDGNVIDGDVLIYDAKNSYIRSEHHLVTAIGVDDLVIVATDDAVLVSPKNRAQDVRHIVAQLDLAGRHEHISHTQVYRPWGHYRNLQDGPGFLVREITVKPWAKLSLQYHHHRAEHWVVVEGQAIVTNGDEVLTLNPNQSTFIPLGAQHRLENPGEIPLRMIEVQSGSYIGEDDIVRMEDDFGRV